MGDHSIRSTLAGQPRLELIRTDGVRPSWLRHGDGSSTLSVVLQPDGSISIMAQESVSGTNRSRRVMIEVTPDQRNELLEFLLANA